MKRRRLRFVVSVICCYLTVCSFAFAQTLIAYIALPNVLDPTNDLAPYNKLMLNALTRVNERHHSLYMPSVRANAALNEQEIDCIFPVVTNGYTRLVNTDYSVPVNQITAHFFTTHNTKIDLSPKLELLVVYQRGIFYGHLFKQYPNVKFVPVEDEEAALQLLLKKRADAYLAYYPDILLSMPSSAYANLTLTKSEPLFTTQDRLECVANEKGKRLIAKFNQAIVTMKNSGELQQLLGNYNNN